MFFKICSPYLTVILNIPISSHNIKAVTNPLSGPLKYSIEYFELFKLTFILEISKLNLSLLSFLKSIIKVPGLSVLPLIIISFDKIFE